MIPRRHVEAGCLLAVALLTAIAFASGTLDIAAARWFFRADAADHWPLAHRVPWLILYRAAPWITASLLVAGLTALMLSLAPRRRRWRGAATLVLLSVVIGPGLIGNAVLKDHWRHPRPRDVIELGGSMRYVPSPLIGREGGASFPCGHCTVGFLYGIGWWIFRRRTPWAVLSLATGVIAGVLLGLGRMAAGAHFLSDVIWSALLAYGVTHLIYHKVLRLDALPALPGSDEPRRSRVFGVVAPFAAAMVLLALYVFPHGSDLGATVALTPESPRILEVDADRATIVITLVDTASAQLAIEGELHGFGLPASHLGARLETVAAPAAELRYTIAARGWLTDVDGFAHLTIPGSAFEHIRVRVGRGDIRVVDATATGVVRAGAVRLDLHTGHGVLQPSAPVP